MALEKEKYFRDDLKKEKKKKQEEEDEGGSTVGGLKSRASQGTERQDHNFTILQVRRQQNEK